MVAPAPGAPRYLHHLYFWDLLEDSMPDKTSWTKIGVAFSTSFAAITGLAILIVAVEIMFRYMNWSLGITFKDHVWKTLKRSPPALALYFGLRVLGVLIAGGFIAAAFLK